MAGRRTKITSKEHSGWIRDAAHLGALFREERKLQDLTLADVHAATGLSTRWLSEFERGKSEPTLGRVLLALSSLGLEVRIAPRGAGRAADVE